MLQVVVSPVLTGDNSDSRYSFILQGQRERIIDHIVAGVSPWASLAI